MLEKVRDFVSRSIGVTPGSACDKCQVVASSAVATIGFRGPDKAIQIEYTNGCIYEIPGMSQMTFDRLRQSNCFDDDLRALVSTVTKLDFVGRATPFVRG